MIWTEKIKLNVAAELFFTDTYKMSDAYISQKKREAVYLENLKKNEPERYKANKDRLLKRLNESEAEFYADLRARQNKHYKDKRAALKLVEVTKGAV